MRKYAIAVLTALVLTVLVMGISIGSRKPFEAETVMDEAFSVREELYSEGGEGARLRKKRYYTVEREDPQVMFAGISEEIRCLGIRLAAPLPEGTKAQLYYVGPGEDISEEQSVTLTSDGKMLNLYYELPELKTYYWFRLDIDTDCEIEDFLASQLPLRHIRASYWEMIQQGRLSFPWRQAVLCFGILLLEGLAAACWWEDIAKWARERRSHLGAFGRGLAVWAAGLGLGALAWVILGRSDSEGNKGLLDYGGQYFLLCGSLLGGLAAMGRQGVSHPGRLFFWVGLHFGLVFVLLEPVTTNMCWDDQIHYARAVVLSNGGEYHVTDAEYYLCWNALSPEISPANALEVRLRAEALDQQLMTHMAPTTLPLFTYPGYLPGAVGLWTARALGLPFSMVVQAGRLSQLVIYLGLMALAIRQMRQGQMVVAILGLMPTVIMLASNYAYDPICIAGITLGTCMCLRMIQEPEGIRHKTAYLLAMLMAFTAGGMSKLVYIPMALVLWCVPGKAYDGGKQKWVFRGLAVAAIALVVAMSWVYMFGSNAEGADVRGSEAASSSGQLSYILAHPLEYAGTLMKFIFNKYLPPKAWMDQGSGFMILLPYVDRSGVHFSPWHAWAILGLAILSLLGTRDRSEVTEHPVRWYMRLWTALLAFGVICLAATSMYIGYTRVGAKTIAGVQSRYMLPAVIPILGVLAPGWVIPRLNQRVLRLLLFAAMAAVCMSGMWTMAQCYL